MRLAPLTGLVAVIFLVVAVLVGGEPPDFDSSGTDVISFYADDEDAQSYAAALFAWGGLFLILFAAYLRGVLRRTEDDPGVLSALSFGGALVAAAGIGIFASIGFTLADAAGEETFEPAAAQALNMMGSDFFFPLAIGWAAFLIGAGLAIVRGGGLPAWLGWIGLALGIVAATPAGFIAFLGGIAWIAITSLVLGLRREPASPGTTAAPPPPAGV